MDKLGWKKRITGLAGLLASALQREKQEQKKSDQHEWSPLELGLAALGFAASPEAIMVSDESGTILLVNPAFTRLTGYTAEEIVGQNPRILSSGQHDPAFYAEMWSAINRQGKWEGEIWNRRKNGEVYLEYLTISAIQDRQGKTVFYCGVFTDITVRKRYEEEIRHHAYHDLLTGLPNRMQLQEYFSAALAEAERSKQALAVLFIDLDGFKEVNDTMGHAAGDQLLQSVSDRLQGLMGGKDAIGRHGGDEFIILLGNLDSVSVAAERAEQIVKRLCQPFVIAGQEVRIGASIGISLFPDHGREMEALMQKADHALYAAKERGGYQYQLFGS